MRSGRRAVEFRQGTRLRPVALLRQSGAGRQSQSLRIKIDKTTKLFKRTIVGVNADPVSEIQGEQMGPQFTEEQRRLIASI